MYRINRIFLVFLSRVIILMVATTYCGNDVSGQFTMQHAYGGSGEELCSKVLVVDGGIVLSGHTTSFGAGDYDFLVLKTDSNGDALWTKTYGGLGEDISLGADTTKDKGFILIGYTNSFGAGSNDILLVKTDSLGNVEWSKAYGSIYGDWGYDVQQTTDGGYILTGYLDVSPPGPGLADTDLILLKTDSIGNVEWSSVFGDSLLHMGREVIQTDEGGYLVSGYSNASLGGLADVFLVKTNSSGVPIWSKTYGAFYSEYGYSVGALDDGYVVATLAYTDIYNTGNSADIVVFRVDSSGGLMWSNVYGESGYDDAWDLIVENDNTITIAGSTNNWSNGETDFLLMKIDENGNLLWSNSFGGNSFDNGYALAKGVDNNYIIAGGTKTYGFGLNDMFFGKTNADGLVGCNANSFSINSTAFSITENNSSDYDPVTVTVTDVNLTSSSQTILHDSVCASEVGVAEINIDSEINVYPNPSNGDITLQFNSFSITQAELRVFNVIGEQVLHETIRINPGTYKLKLDLERFGKGIYFLNLLTGARIQGQKVIVQ